MDKDSLSQFIKRKSVELGFDACGISKAVQLEQEAKDLEKWLNQNRQGKMAYMANNFDKRIDPRKLVDGAKSVISLTYNYFNPLLQEDPKAPKISKYAYGRDYHKVLKKKLKLLLESIKEIVGNINGRCFVDSAPVLERAWAQKSGLGWIGKNTLLLSKSKGSFFFLSEIILDIELVADGPVKDYCGTCTKCIDACPTNAIYEPYKVDGSKCISYFTIELKDATLPSEMSGKFQNWMFGCDICQDVCPINSRSIIHNDEDFNPPEELLKLSRKEWKDISNEIFDSMFKGSAVKRTKYHGLKRNINFLD